MAARLTPRALAGSCSAIRSARASLSASRFFLSPATSAASVALALRDGRFRPRASLAHAGSPLVLQLAPQLLQFLVGFAARRAKSRLVLGGFFRRFRQTCLGQLPRAFRRLVAQAQHLLQGFEEDELQVEVQQDDENESRDRF